MCTDIHRFYNTHFVWNFSISFKKKVHLKKENTVLKMDIMHKCSRGIKGRNKAVNYFFERVISSSLDIYPKAGLLGNMIVLFLTFQGTAIMFYSSSTNLHFHQQCTRGPFAPYSCQYLYFLFVIISLVF